MRESIRKFLIIYFSLLVTLLTSWEIHPQEFEIRKNSYFLPGEMLSGKFTHLMGVAAIKMPEEIIEDETFLRVPLFFYKIKAGLPKNFSATASLESNIITLHAEGGLGWNFLLKKFSFSPEIKSSYWIGRLKQYGFDSGMSGFNVTPAFSTGYSFGKFGVTFSAELFYQISNTIKNGDITISREPKRFNGYSAAIYIEQPLWKNNVVVIGFKSLLLELYYPVWVAFSTFKRPFHVTEATVGLIL